MILQTLRGIEFPIIQAPMPQWHLVCYIHQLNPPPKPAVTDCENPTLKKTS
jgi:hypothetical protein